MVDFFGELNIKWPRVIMKWLLVGILLVAVLWGILTWNKEKGVQFYFQYTEAIVFKPLINWSFRRAGQINEYILTPFLYKIFQIENNKNLH